MSEVEPALASRWRVGTLERRLLVVLWVMVLLAMPVWTKFDKPGWDVGIYHNAMRALAAGHDPYADAIAVQQAYHAQAANHTHADPPWSYVYSPITLPLLREINHVSPWVSGILYWLLYSAGAAAQLWFGMQAVERREWRVFLFLAPVATFFPGFLANGIVLSGNVAYLLYGAVLLAAILGWRRGRWSYFYAAVLAASCVKAPLLSLVVLPVLSARRQWIATTVTAACGAAMFALQPVIWPVLFRHYLQAVELQFSYNRDFGCSPAGLFSGFLFDRGISYSPASFYFYLAYAIPLLGLLFYLSRRFFAGEFPLTRWGPVLVTGVILLNPRLIEYDVAPLALPLTLIAWRFLSSLMRVRRAVVVLAGLFVVLNSLALYSWDVRKLADGPVLVVFFLAGCWGLVHPAGGREVGLSRLR